MTSAFQVSAEPLSNADHQPTFSRAGLGRLLEASFSGKFLARSDCFPNLPRTRTLLMVADFGGHHQRQLFDTYTFLFLDIGKNAEWFVRQRYYRSHILPNKRRMSFKALNDSQRRDALVPFLQMASRIEGGLVQFAISKVGGSLFAGASEENAGAALLSLWKPAVQERLLRIIHLSSFLLSGFSAPHQDLLWIIDEDDIAANVPQLTQLTEVFSRVFSHYATHGLRHIRCGTTKSDDGTLALEDLTAVADLTTGALGEVCTGFIDQAGFPRPNLVTPLPSGLSWKTRLIASWMGVDGWPLRRHTTVLELEPSSTKVVASNIGWKAVQGAIILP
jgi:hypothetical protein